MPFRSDAIIERFEASRASHRLGHAYLLTGTSEDDIEKLGLRLSATLLNESGEIDQHPDFYRVRPESKSRRITIEQMRDLEKSLYLKPFKAPMKVAMITSAERMCLGQAEAANAFLKTLEEPPAATLILICTNRPQLLLPTIISRCLRLDLLAEGVPDPTPEMTQFLSEWFGNNQPPAVRAYARAAALSAYWQLVREKLEDRETPTDGDGVSEEAFKALLEGEFQLARQETLATIQREYWKRAVGQNEAEIPKTTLRAVIALEELQQSLSQNIEQNLAVERALLALEALI